MFGRHHAFFGSINGALVAALAAVALVALVACDRSEGEAESEARGPAKTIERQLPGGFSGVVVPGKTEVIVRKGKQATARLSGPANYIEDIELKIEKRKAHGKEISVLVVDLSRGVKVPLPTVEVYTEALVYVEAMGPARVQLDDFSGEELTLIATDATKIELAAGAYAKVTVDASRAARIQASEVMVEEAHFRASGPSRVAFGQVARLKRDLMPPGKIIVQGQPEPIK